MRDNMKDLTNKIQNLGDRRFWDEFIPVFNDYLDHRLRVENKFSIKKYNCIKEYYDGSGSNQATQDFTKGVAGTFESIIELIATENDMDYEACASDGFDGLILLLVLQDPVFSVGLELYLVPRGGLQTKKGQSSKV